MSRLSIRPRPLDIHKKLPIVKSVKEFEDDEVAIAAASTRNSQLFRQAAENDNEGYQTPSKKNAQEIPTPQYSTVDTYERDYSRTFMPSTSYIRGRGVRSEIGEFVEYDLDNEDDDWLEDFNNGRMNLTPEKFEILLFKLEVLDQKSREKAGLIMPTFGSPVPVILQLEAAAEALKFLSLRLSVLQSVYSYWKAKRERWQKPILRRLQPPPPVNDTNPYNVFRLREKAHRLHTRRMQRRENNAQSFEKLRQVRRSLDQAKRLMEALIKREETKLEILECEVNLQRIQTKYKHEAFLIEDGMTYPGFEQTSSDEDYIDSDDNTNGHLHAGLATHHPKYVNSKFVTFPTVRIKHKLKRRPLANGWIHKEDVDAPVMLFTKPLDLDKLVAAGIRPPSAPHVENDSVFPTYRFHGRIGRGGRIIFDRWNPFSQAPIGQESASYVAPNPAPLPNG